MLAPRPEAGSSAVATGIGPEGLAELGHALALIPADAHPADTQFLGGISAAQTHHASIFSFPGSGGAVNRRLHHKVEKEVCWPGSQFLDALQAASDTSAF